MTFSRSSCVRSREQLIPCQRGDGEKQHCLSGSTVSLVPSRFRLPPFFLSRRVLSFRRQPVVHLHDFPILLRWETSSQRVFVPSFPHSSCSRDPFPRPFSFLFLPVCCRTFLASSTPHAATSGDGVDRHALASFVVGLGLVLDRSGWNGCTCFVRLDLNRTKRIHPRFSIGGDPRVVQERWVASRCVGQVCREEEERRTVHRARPSRERWEEACVVRRRTSTRVPWIAVHVVLTNVVVPSDPFETLLLLLSRKEKKPSPPTPSNRYVCASGSAGSSLLPSDEKGSTNPWFEGIGGKDAGGPCTGGFDPPSLRSNGKKVDPRVGSGHSST